MSLAATGSSRRDGMPVAARQRESIVPPESQRTLDFVFGQHDPGLSPEAVALRSQRRFVRGNDQISIYDPERNPTGHVLTALEAYEAFGIDVLAEAVEYNSAVILRRVGAIESALRRRREALGLTSQALARAVHLRPDEIELAESDANRLPIQSLERIAFALGLDDRSLAYDPNAGADEKLAVSLRTLQSEADVGSPVLSAAAVLALSEAASVVRVQSRLKPALAVNGKHREFDPCPDYGSHGNPAWRIGYGLAEQARQHLGLRDEPVPSMRGLVEETLGVPVIEARLPSEIAGATVAVAEENGREYRGIVLNTIGQNQNVWIRRATLAHELGHLLYDPEDHLGSIRVDTYDTHDSDPQGRHGDYVEQRANAFAIAFLAPLNAVRGIAPTPITSGSVSEVMKHFGLSLTSARFHVSNAHYRQYDVPSFSDIPETRPGDDWRASEDFTADYFPIAQTPIQRRGQFAGVVAVGHEHGLIRDQTAAAYLGCNVREFRSSLGAIRSIYPQAS